MFGDPAFVNQNLCRSTGLPFVQVGFVSQGHDGHRLKRADGGETTRVTQRQAKVLKVSLVTEGIRHLVQQVQTVSQ